MWPFSPLQCILSYYTHVYTSLRSSYNVPAAAAAPRARAGSTSTEPVTGVVVPRRPRDGLLRLPHRRERRAAHRALLVGRLPLRRLHAEKERGGRGGLGFRPRRRRAGGDGGRRRGEGRGTTHRVGGGEARGAVGLGVGRPAPAGGAAGSEARRARRGAPRGGAAAAARDPPRGVGVQLALAGTAQGAPAGSHFVQGEKRSASRARKRRVVLMCELTLLAAQLAAAAADWRNLQRAVAPEHHDGARACVARAAGRRQLRAAPSPAPSSRSARVRAPAPPPPARRAPARSGSRD
jgi:hypothetical protein